MRALKILDEVGSDNPLSREDADAIEALQARAEKAEAQRDALAKALVKARIGIVVLGDATRHLGLQLGQDQAAKMIEEIDAALDAIKGEN